MAKKLKFKRLARSKDFEKSEFFCFVYFIFMVVSRHQTLQRLNGELLLHVFTLVQVTSKQRLETLIEYDVLSNTVIWALITRPLR